MAIEFAYPEAAVETAIVAHEAGIDEPTARHLVEIGKRSRNLRGNGLDEGASTRMLIHAAQLIACGTAMRDAVRASIVVPITDDADMRDALDNAFAACEP